MKTMKSHPDYPVVVSMAKRLRQYGHVVFFAGGCVRDGLLARQPNDFDLATDATPDQVISIFPKTISVGKSFGVIIVVENEVKVEVTTFRRDGSYEDGRRPSSIEFSSPEEDALRRDFTINALFYEDESDRIIDFVGGLKDLQRQTIKCVGAPTQRFLEDHLRMLRAIRFVGQLNFHLDEPTRLAIQQQGALLAKVSPERVREEMEKLITSQNQIKALKELSSLGLDVFLLNGCKQKLDQWIEVWECQEKNRLLAWFIFWNIYWKNESTTSLIDQQLSQWKFSNADKRVLVQMLEWRISPQLFLEKPLGELAEKCFSPHHQLAFEIYANVGIIDLSRFQIVRETFLRWEGKKPDPLVKIKDLPQHLHGEQIGQTLKKAYWAQLEGRINSPSDALGWIKLN